MDAWSKLFLAYLLAVLVCVSVFRLGLRMLIKAYRTKGGNLRFVVLVGSADNNRELYQELTSQSWAGYRVLGYFDFEPNGNFPQECPYLGKPQEVTDYLKKHGNTHFLFCCLPSKDREVIMPIIDYCENNLVHFYSVPNVHNYLQNRMYFNMMGNVPYLSLRQDPLSRLGNKMLKRMLLGGEVTILADEPLYGVVSCMPPHLLKAGEQNKAVPIDQMAIDTGLLDAKSRIRVGTPIVFAQQPIKLAGGQLCSKCLDDRAGVAAILLAMEQLHAAKDKLKCNVAVLISTQEEVTELGAQTGAFTVQPEYAIAVDVTHGRTPDGPSDGVFDLGSGVAVGMGPNLHRGFTKALIKTAKANDIDYTLEIMEGNTGTNAWTMQIVGHGIAMGLLSIPEKYMHTPVEVVKLSDVQAVADLMAEFLRGFDGEVGA